MIKKMYSDSMKMLQFSADFDKKTIEKMEKVARQTKQCPDTASTKSRFKWQHAAFPAIACALVAVAIFALPMLPDRVAEPETTINASANTTGSLPINTSANTAGSLPSVIEAITVVDAKLYNDMRDSMTAPKPGEIRFDEGVYSAVNDPATDDMYFFVQLSLMNNIGATELGAIEDYLYAGRTIAEWRVLVDLANGTYPYSEYSGDHGGNITEAEYKAAIDEAKTLNAAANLEAAVDEYNAKYETMYPDPEALRMDALVAECTRLKTLGYDVKLYETWTYYGDKQKEYRTILVGLFTKDELLKLRDENANPQLAMIVSWVRNGNGIENWNYSKWDYK